MIKAVLFDFDGTIGDTLGLCVEAFRRALEPLIRRRCSDEEILATFGPSEEGTVTRLLPPERQAEGLTSYFYWYRTLHGDCGEPFPGIVELLRGLKRAGLVVGLITGKGAVTCEISLRQYGMSDLFDVVETGSPLGACKPDCFRRVLAKFSLSPSETLYVGDMPSDIRAAREVGIETIAAAWASSARLNDLRAERPLAICETVQRLGHVLANQPLSSRVFCERE